LSNTSALVAGFEASIPQTDAEIDGALKAGLLSLDANVLLNFYRYSPNARDALIAVLKAAEDRAWVSHQAAREFWRNRYAAIDSRSQATEQLQSALDKNETAVNAALETWAKQTAVPEDAKQEVVDALAAGFTTARELVDAEVEGAGVVAYDTESDAVLTVLLDLLSSHVGPALPEDEREAALKEGLRRSNELIPPGFLDADKADGTGPDGPSGDYLVWLQSIKEASRRDLPLVIVTGDEKEDWWWKHRNVFLGPRPELVEEFSKHSKRRLFMLRPVQLIDHADVLDVAVSKDAAIDVARASSDDRNPRWTRQAVLELLKRLDSEGREQADVIRFAAEQGGMIDREQVYEIGEYSEDRMLRGFTRPSARISQALVEDGLLASGVEPALTPIYEGGMTALHFRIPPEIVEVLNTGDEPSSATRD